MDKRHDIELLNSLIVTTIDSALGFEESARDVRNRRYEGQFRAFAGERRQLVERLQAEVRRLGGTLEDDGSVKAAAHRRWVNFKDAVTGRSDKAVISEVNNGETYIRDKYETALRNEKLSPETRSAIEEGLGSVRAGHFFAKRLNQALSSGSSSSGGWGLRLAGAAGLAGAAYAAYRMFGSRQSRQEHRDNLPRVARENDEGRHTNERVGMGQRLHQSSSSRPSWDMGSSPGAATMTAAITGTGTIRNERGQHDEGQERTSDTREAEGSGYVPSIDKSGL